MAPMVSAVAAEEPEMAAKTVHDKMVATLRPPGQCRTRVCMAL